MVILVEEITVALPRYWEAMRDSLAGGLIFNYVPSMMLTRRCKQRALWEECSGMRGQRTHFLPTSKKAKSCRKSGCGLRHTRLCRLMGIYEATVPGPRLLVPIAPTVSGDFTDSLPCHVPLGYPRASPILCEDSRSGHRRVIAGRVVSDDTVHARLTAVLDPSRQWQCHYSEHYHLSDQVRRFYQGKPLELVTSWCYPDGPH